MMEILMLKDVLFEFETWYSPNCEPAEIFVGMGVGRSQPKQKTPIEEAFLVNSCAYYCIAISLGWHLIAQLYLYNKHHPDKKDTAIFKPGTRASLWPAHDWFLEIAFVCNVSMLVYVCVCPQGY